MLRMFAPPEDRVKGIFHGAGSPMQERKLREMEKKKAYAAELQAQMREREQQKQMERIQRFGAPAGGQGNSGYQQANAVPANFSGPEPPHIDSSVAADPTPATHWPAYGSSPPAYGIAAQPPQQAFAPAYQQQQQQQQQPSWQVPGPLGGPNMGSSYTSSPNSYGSPMYAHSPPAEPPARSYQEQLDFSPGGWPGAGMPPPAAAQLPAYMRNNYDPYAGPAWGNMGLGRQPYAAMSVGPPPDPYGSMAMYGGPAAAGAYGAADHAAAAAAPSSWGQTPARFPGAVAGSIGNYNGIGNGSSAYGPGPPAATGPTAAASRNPPAWGPSQAPGTRVPGAAAGGPSAAAAKSKKDAYREELEAQIRDKAARKAAEKSAIAAEDARKEAEQAGYDPWGRAGAGAPIRNAGGQVVSNIRGGRQPVQQQEQYQQQQQQQQQPYQQAPDYADGPSAAMESSSYWDQGPDAAANQDRYQQQGPPGGPAAAAAAGRGAATAAGGGPAGAPPMLNFRSDTFMTADEVERKQQRQAELQRELAQQIEEKKRRKELEQKQAEDEARREDERLAAEQARLTSQFQQEQDKQKMKDKQSTQKEEQVAGAWNAAREAAEQDRRKTKEERRRSQGQVLTEPSSGNFQRQSSIQQNSQPGTFYNQGQPNHTSNAGGNFQQRQAAAADSFQQFQVPQQQERQQMMMEALRLEEDKIRQMAAQEVERLRAEMAAQAAALRDVVERQGGEVAALRAAAAVAEAESMAAKSELLQVRQDMRRRSQEMQHETLSTILADYGNAPTSRIEAAYHPSPIRRIELDLPPPAATMRRSVQLQNAAAPATPPASSNAAAAANGFAAEREGSAVDLLESLLQHGRQQQQQQPASYAAADTRGQPPRRSSAATGSKSWLNSIPANQAGNVRGSMLVSESTFIFPAGIPVEAPQGSGGDGDGNEELGGAGLGASGILGSTGQALRVSQGPTTAGLPSSSSAMDLGSHWGLWQGEQPVLQRHTTSAPGSSDYVPADRAGPFAAASQSRRTNSINRRGLVTPGGSDLTSVVDRNANRLQLLNSMPIPGDSEALDEFLAKFLSKTSQPNQRNIATPPSRLLSANAHKQPQQYHTVQLLQQPSTKILPSRYGSIAENSTTAASYGATQGASALANAAEAAAVSNLFMGIADTLDQENSRVGVASVSDSMRPPRMSASSAAAAAQQRLLHAGASGVEASDPSMLGTSSWVAPGLEAGL